MPHSKKLDTVHIWLSFTSSSVWVVSINFMATPVLFCLTVNVGCVILLPTVLPHSFISMYSITLDPFSIVAFAKLRTATISFVMSVYSSVHSEKFGSLWTDINEIWYLSIFLKSAEKIQVSLQSDNNNGYFTWRPLDAFDHISLSSS